MAIAVHPRVFTVDDYYAMGKAGILGPEERVELLDGEILTMPPIGPAHAGTVNRLTAMLSRRLGSLAIVQVQNPVRLSTVSEPQPDIALLHRRDDFYTSRHATAADVFAIIEVAQSSFPYDRGRKLHAYARCGIREYWIVNLEAAHVEIFREPSGEGYKRRTTAHREETVAFESFPEERFDVVEVLGPSNE